MFSQNHEKMVYIIHHLPCKLIAPGVASVAIGLTPESKQAIIQSIIDGSADPHREFCIALFLDDISTSSTQPKFIFGVPVQCEQHQKLILY